MRSLNAGLSVVLLSQVGIAQAPLADLPFTLHQGGIIVKLVANDRDTVTLLLDTGWGPMALTDVAAARLARTTDLPRPGGSLTFASLAAQSLRKTQVFVEVFASTELTPLIGPYDGVLATEFFKDLVVQVDYPASRVRFFSRAPATDRDVAPGSRSEFPMSFSRGAGALPFTDSVTVNGRAARGLFDTGGMGAFVAMGRLITSQQLERAPDAGSAQMGFFDGASSRASVRFVRLDQIRVGTVVVDNPRVLLAPQQLEGANWGHDLVIGYGFMRDYVVTFDYPGRTIRLQRVP